MVKIKQDENSKGLKVGLNEVVGLERAVRIVLKPVQEFLKKEIYWDDCEFKQSEYRSRDGFIPYSDNCGGLELRVIIPKCHESDFQFLDFGDCEECQELFKKHADDKNDPKMCGRKGEDCSYDSEGYLDAKLRVWLKFEGLSEGVMSFYLVLSGGNNDAPYFRESRSALYFESEFKAKTLTEFKKKAKKHIAKLIKKMDG